MVTVTDAMSPRLLKMSQAVTPRATLSASATSLPVSGCFRRGSIKVSPCPVVSMSRNSSFPREVSRTAAAMREMMARLPALTNHTTATARTTAARKTAQRSLRRFFTSERKLNSSIQLVLVADVFHPQQQVIFISQGEGHIGVHHWVVQIVYICGQAHSVYPQV